MRNKEIVDTTINSRVYKIALKMHREQTCEIYCSRCPYHKVENYNYGENWSHRKSWKRNTKRSKQYKRIKNIMYAHLTFEQKIEIFNEIFNS